MEKFYKKLKNVYKSYIGGCLVSDEISYSISEDIDILHIIDVLEFVEIDFPDRESELKYINDVLFLAFCVYFDINEADIDNFKLLKSRDL